MYHNVDVDWKVFSYKFSGQEEHAFQQLAYLLFCAEYSLPIGIFSYYNQIGIETEPVRINNQVVGFQAKYFAQTVSVSTKVPVFKKMISDSKKRNPELTKILVYTNKEFSESKKAEKKKPKYQDDIEKFGNNNGIIIEWRVRSNFEAMLFSDLVPAYVRDYFFNPNSGIREFFEQIELHSDSIIKSIENEIKFNSKCISIERPSLKLNDFMKSNCECLIIHGEAGTGKSGIIRSFFLHQKNDDTGGKYPIFVFKATDFGCSSIPEFSKKFGDVNSNEFFSAFDNHEMKVIIIDAAEKIFTNPKNILPDFITRVVDLGWKIIVTIRTSYKDNFTNYILRTDSWKTLEVDNISPEYLYAKLKEIGIEPPHDRRLQSLICNLFYLNLYIQTYDKSQTGETKAQFYSKIWDLRIKGLPRCSSVQSLARERFVCLMLQTIIDSNSYYYRISHNTGQAGETAEMLVEDAVITYDATFGGYSFSHDAFEEMVARFIIKCEYSKSTSFVELFSSLSIRLPMRKHYRHWLLENLDESLVKKIPSIFMYKGIEKIWKDETLIALMAGVEETSALVMTENLLSHNNFELLFRAIYLLNTACRVIDRSLFGIARPEEQIGSRYAYRFTQPIGVGWAFIIRNINDNKTRIIWTEKSIRPAVELLTTWSNSQKHSIVTRSAGEIALFLYDKWIIDKHFLGDRDFEKKIFGIIASSAHEIKDELISIFESIISAAHLDKRSVHIELCEFLVKDIFSASVACEAIPESIIALCDKLWRRIEPPKDELYHYHQMDSVENSFGLTRRVNYYPTSAYQTPVFALLRNAPKPTIRFIIDFINYASVHFHTSDMNCIYRESDWVEISFEDDLSVKQLCSGRFWGLHRGISAGPNLLESILMALEKWLLKYIEESDEEHANELCKFLLRESNNVCITSVITSLVVAYPEKLFSTALWLIHIKDIFSLDIQRFTYEDQTDWFRGMPSNKLYDNERLEANKLMFRKNIFRQVIINYQIYSFGDNEKDWASKKAQLYECIDDLEKKVLVADTSTRLALNRIDLRKYRINADSSKTSNDGKKYIELVVDDEPDLVEIIAQSNRDFEDATRYSNVSVWARERYEKNEDGYSKHMIFENDPALVIREIKKITDDVRFGKEVDYLAHNTPVFGASVLIRDFYSSLTEEQTNFCCDILLESMSVVYSLVPKHEISDGTLAVLCSMPFLFDRMKPDSEDYAGLIVSYALALLTDNSDRRKSCSIFATTLWDTQPAAATIIFSLFVCLIPEFRTWQRTIRAEKTIEQFIFLNKQKIEGTIASGISMDPVAFSDFDVSDLMNVSLVLDINNEKHYELFIQVFADGIFQRVFHESRHYSNGDMLDYQIVLSFIEWLADFIYFTSGAKADKLIYLIMIKACEASSYVNSLLTKILFRHDTNNDNNKFWHIWDELFPYIKTLCEKRKEALITSRSFNHYELDRIIETYCFAWPWWGEEQKRWIGVQYEHLDFFENVAREIGYMPATLYSFTNFLCTIGSDYIIEGVSWLSKIIEENENLLNCELMVNTIFNLENVLIDLVAKHEDEVRKKESLRDDAMIILNYLVERGSTVGFLIREELF